MATSIPEETCYRIEEHPGLGRVLVATRDIFEGETILDEEPLVVFGDLVDPLWTREIKKWANRRGSDYAPRTICKWCAGYLSTTSDVKQIWESWFLHSTTGPLDNLFHELASILCELPGENINPAELARALVSCSINAHSYQKDHYALFKIGSMAIHSCFPNSTYKTSSGKFTMRTVAMVRAGERLSTSYLDWETLCWPTKLRRKYLFTTKNFHCNCERCVALDTTRALPCPSSGCSGYVYCLQRNVNDAPLWKCDSGNVAECRFAQVDLDGPFEATLSLEDFEIFRMEEELLEGLWRKEMKGTRNLFIKSLRPDSITTLLRELEAMVGTRHWAYADTLFQSVEVLYEYGTQNRDESAVIMFFTHQFAFFEWAQTVFVDDSLSSVKVSPHCTKAIQTINTFYEYVNANEPALSWNPSIGPLLPRAIELVHTIEPSVRWEWGEDDVDAVKMRQKMLNYCAQCGMHGNLKCGGCQRTVYCSKAWLAFTLTLIPTLSFTITITITITITLTIP